MPQPDVSMMPSSSLPPDLSQPNTSPCNASPHDPSSPRDPLSLHDPSSHNASPHDASPRNALPRDSSLGHSSLPLPDVLVPPTSATLEAQNDSVTTGMLTVSDTFAAPSQLPSFDINTQFTPEELQTYLSGMTDSES